MKFLAVVGTRPNFVKLAALQAEMRRHPHVRPVTVHTGQHYDPCLSDAFFRDLEMDPPQVHLGVEAPTSLGQLAAMLAALEPVLREHRPDLVLVVGDVNSTLAGALAASRLRLPLAHVEAGLRSFDPEMPEEVNRRVTDSLADHLFATEEAALANLRREGIPPDRVHLVGNVMIDTLLRFRSRAERSGILGALGLEPGGYAVLTLHRPTNVDRPARLAALLQALGELAREHPVVFPVHPRTRSSLPADLPGRIIPLDPLAYLDFIHLQANARLALTDSGGVQDETTVLGVPCLTLRRGTERPVTVTHGTNRVVGTDPGAIREACRQMLVRPPRARGIPPLWDGKASRRIMHCLLEGHRDPVASGAIASETPRGAPRE